MSTPEHLYFAVESPNGTILYKAKTAEQGREWLKAHSYNERENYDVIPVYDGTGIM